MKRIVMAAAALGATGTMASAGGVERSASPYAILWEKGNYAEFSFGRISPDVSGTVGGGALASGDMLDAYTQASFGIKYALGDALDVALVIDQPIGADVAYPLSAAPYPLAGTTGTIDSTAITGLLRYRLDNGFSFHGGIKAQRTKGSVALPAYSYAMSTSSETDLGYLLGVAWERPDIALRVALTYQSAIKHDFAAAETLGPFSFNTAFTTEVPQSVTLDFQSGIARDTLVFGSVRWREWKAFTIDPVNYPARPLGALVYYDNNVVTWTLGVGRRFNENWAGSVAFAHERHEGTPVGNLNPVDGLNSLTVGASYTRDNMKISGGVSYVWNGNATTRLIGADFRDNHTLGVGLKVGFTF